MKNKVNYSSPGIIPPVIAGIMTFAAIEFFLKSNLVAIHKGTPEGGLINVIGYLAIAVLAAALSITTMLLIKNIRKSMKNEKVVL